VVKAESKRATGAAAMLVIVNIGAVRLVKFVAAS